MYRGSFGFCLFSLSRATPRLLHPPQINCCTSSKLQHFLDWLYADDVEPSQKVEKLNFYVNVTSDIENFIKNSEILGIGKEAIRVRAGVQECMCVCVCVCVRERERERESGTTPVNSSAVSESAGESENSAESFRRGFRTSDLEPSCRFERFSDLESVLLGLSLQ